MEEHLPHAIARRSLESGQEGRTVLFFKSQLAVGHDTAFPHKVEAGNGLPFPPRAVFVVAFQELKGRFFDDIFGEVSQLGCWVVG